ncbi:MAG: DUF6600 domain-containing protein [Vicinamibacterales bacterium]
MKRLPVGLAILVAVGLVAIAAPSAAQTYDADDPPARVARLNYLRGSVSFRPAALDEWGPATVNYPLTAGDRLWTDEESLAEMHVGSTVVRLAPFTAFSFLTLDDRTVQMRLSEGSLDIVVRRLDYGEIYEIDTPQAAITLVTPGIYRVDVGPEGDGAKVTVRQGQAEVFGDQDEFRVYQGQTAEVRGYGTGTRWDVYEAVAPDSWERWARTRDEREARSLSLQYVSNEMVGYEDLDEYGTWYSEPDYGYVWRPRYVPAGWAPYRHGHWAWIEPWGWTWIDDAPWGFAPFHYGRWAYVRSYWCWVPGVYVARPYYAPHLAVFIGGRNWGLSFGFGFRGHGVGWFPLGPREFYYPGFRASHRFIRGLNVAHVNVTSINITNYNIRNVRHVNRFVQGGVTAVGRDDFLTARSLRRVAVPVGGQAVLRAEVLGTTSGFAPAETSVIAGRGVAVPRRAQAAFARMAVARTAPAAPVAPLRERVKAIEANGGQPVDGRRLAVARQPGVGAAVLPAADGLPVRQAGRARERAVAGAEASRPGGTSAVQRGAPGAGGRVAPGAAAGDAGPMSGTADRRSPAAAGRPADAAGLGAAQGSRAVSRSSEERPAPASMQGRAAERRSPTGAEVPAGSTKPPGATTRSRGAEDAIQPSAVPPGRSAERRTPASVGGAPAGSIRPPGATSRSGGAEEATQPSGVPSGRAVERRSPGGTEAPAGSTRPPSAATRSGGAEEATQPSGVPSGRAVERRSPSGTEAPAGSTRPPGAATRARGSEQQSSDPSGGAPGRAVGRRVPDSGGQSSGATRPPDGTSRSRGSTDAPPPAAHPSRGAVQRPPGRSGGEAGAARPPGSTSSSNRIQATPPTTRPFGGAVQRDVGPSADRPPSASQYRTPSVQRTAPGYGASSAPRAAPQYRAPFATRSTPSFSEPTPRAAPQYRAPSTQHSTPTYSVPSAPRSTPQYRAPSPQRFVPGNRAQSAPRSVPRSAPSGGLSSVGSRPQSGGAVRAPSGATRRAPSGSASGGARQRRQ